jgi:hypothetical protein
MCRVDGRRCRAKIDKGEPAGVAMGQDVDNCAFFAPRDFPDDDEPTLPDASAMLGILVGDGQGFSLGDGLLSSQRGFA